jgi:hypothetical protein
LEVILAMVHFLRRSLVVVASIVLAVPLTAAPSPTDEPGKIDKFFPDETTGVFVFNFKLIRESKAYTKGLQKTIDDLLKKDEVQAILKEAGLDPTKDIDRVVLGIVPGREGMGGPFFVIEGRFDPTFAFAMACSMSSLDVARTTVFWFSIAITAGSPGPIFSSNALTWPISNFLTLPAQIAWDVRQALGSTNC